MPRVPFLRQKATASCFFKLNLGNFSDPSVLKGECPWILQNFLIHLTAGLVQLSAGVEDTVAP